ncbi:hypothetical protein BSN85_22850 [Bradyrhizobium brasilense]|nr:hypothetical protein BSN85_22850 [Bradyrhizobium brasilense]
MICAGLFWFLPVFTSRLGGGSIRISISFQNRLMIWCPFEGRCRPSTRMYDQAEAGILDVATVIPNRFPSEKQRLIAIEALKRVGVLFTSWCRPPEIPW